MSGPRSENGKLWVSAGGHALLLLMFVYLIAMLDRVILSVLLQPIKQEFHLSDTQLGFISGTGFAVALSLAVLPMGYLADRVKRKRAIVILVTAWSLLTLISGLAPGFLLLCLARVGLGFAEGGQAPFALSLIADLFPARARATALSLLYMGVPIGMLTGLLLGGYVAQAYSWHVAMMVASAPGLLLALVIGLTLREPPRGQLDAAAGDPHTSAAAQSGHAPLTFGQSLSYIVGTPALLHLFAGAALSAAVASAMGVWLPALLMRDFALSIGKVAPALAMTGGTAGIVGSLICGPITDRLARGRPGKMAFVAASFVLLIYPATMLCVTAASMQSALLFNAVFNLLLPGYLAALHGTVLGITDARVRGFVVATLGIMLNLLGYGVGPQLVGMASDWFAARGVELPLREAMVMLLTAALWGAAHFYYAAYRLRRTAPRLEPSPKT
jgi:MFS family permease